MMKERNELATPALSGLLDFWLTKSDGGMPPVSSSIAPADLRPWKDNIVVFEVIGEDDFVYSYYGKALAEAFGHSRLGATLDELPKEQRAILYPEYATVRRERLPVARVYTADFGGAVRTWERLVLPMSSDGTAIDKLLVAAYEMPGETTGEQAGRTNGEEEAAGTAEEASVTASPDAAPAEPPRDSAEPHEATQDAARTDAQIDAKTDAQIDAQGATEPLDDGTPATHLHSDQPA
jgi:hypothetical protein